VSDGPGSGSEFVVRLPVCPDEVVFPVGRPSPRDREHPLPRRVLVADDNVDSADMERRCSRPSGARSAPSTTASPRCARPSASARRRAARHRHADIDGHEVCARIRSQSWGGNIVLIAVSGWGQEGDRRRSARAGFNMHLVKPVDPDALAADRA
jgi:CheY-like chemotaxis protein